MSDTYEVVLEERGQVAVRIQARDPWLAIVLAKGICHDDDHVDVDRYLDPDVLVVSVRRLPVAARQEAL